MYRQTSSISRKSSRSLLVLLSVLVAVGLCAIVYFVTAAFWNIVIGPIFISDEIYPRHKSFMVYLVTMLALYAGTMVFLIAKNLFERAELPEGLSVAREKAPVLWKGIDDICANANVPSPDHVVLLAEANAFAAEVPTRGLLGKQERVLGLGLPLLEALSLEQGAAVIAHEVKHFKSRDGRLSQFTNLTADLAGTIVRNDDESAWMMAFSFLARLYLKLYCRIEAADSRAAEFEADAFAAKLFGQKETADALIALETMGGLTHHEFGKTLMNIYRAGGSLPTSLTRHLTETIKGVEKRKELQERLDHALKSTTGKHDSHPALRERLAALGIYKPTLPLYQTGQSAAKALLWESYETVSKEMDQYLIDSIGKDFEARSEEVGRVRRLVDQHMPAIEDGTATREQAEIISLIIEEADFEDDDTYHNRILSNYPDIPSSLCSLALTQIRDKRIEGAEAMLTTYEHFPLMSGEAKRFLQWACSFGGDLPFECQWLASWLNDDVVQSRIEAAFDKGQEAFNAWERLINTREPEPHGLADWHIHHIVQTARDNWQAQKVWIVRMNAPEIQTPCFIMIVQAENEIPVPRGATAQFALPGPITFDVLDPAMKRLRKFGRQLLEAPGALVFDSNEEAELKVAA